MVLLSFVRSSGWSFDAVFSETEASDGGSAVSFVRHPDKNKIITNINIKIKFFFISVILSHLLPVDFIRIRHTIQGREAIFIDFYLSIWYRI